MNGLTFFNNSNVDIFDKLFDLDDFWTRPALRTAEDKHEPSVKDLDDKYDISLIAPGLDKKDFSITVDGNHLTIGYDASNKKESYAYATKYTKTYTIPADCDVEGISASYKNGVMIVALPKTESAKPRTIQIK